MKKLNTKYFTIAVYAVAVLAFCVVFLLLGVNISAVFSFIGWMLGQISPLIYGILFALILLPLVKLFDRMYGRLYCRNKEHPVLVCASSLFTVYLLFLVLFFVSLGFVIPPLTTDLMVVLQEVQSLLVDTSAYLDKVFPGFGEWMQSIEANGGASILAEFAKSFSASLQNLFAGDGGIFSAIISTVSAIFAQFPDILFGLVISAYFLATRRYISAVCGKIVIAVFPEKAGTKFVIFFKRLYLDFCSFASSRIFISFLVCCGVFICSLIFQVPLFSIIVVILFFCQLFPVVGTTIGVLFASFTVLALDPVKAIGFIPTLITCEILVAHFITPKLQSKKLRLSYGLSAVLVLIGYAFFGFVGALLSVPIYATLNVEFRSFLAHRLAKKHMPIAADTYEQNDFSDAITAAELYAQKHTPAEEMISEETTSEETVSEEETDR